MGDLSNSGLVCSNESGMDGGWCHEPHLQSRAIRAAFEEAHSDAWLPENVTAKKNFVLQASSGGVLALRPQLPT